MVFFRLDSLLALADFNSGAYNFIMKASVFSRQNYLKSKTEYNVSFIYKFTGNPLTSIVKLVVFEILPNNFSTL